MRIVLTLNMPSQKGRLIDGGLVHQIIADVGADDFNELHSTLEEDRFLLIEEVYVYKHDQSKRIDYQIRGPRLINVDHIGKISPFNAESES